MGKDSNFIFYDPIQAHTEMDNLLNIFNQDKCYPVLVGIFGLFKKNNYEPLNRKFLVKSLQSEYKKNPEKFRRRDGEIIEGNKTFYDTIIQSFYRGKCFRGKTTIEIIPDRSIILMRTLVKRRNKFIENGYPTAKIKIISEKELSESNKENKGHTGNKNSKKNNNYKKKVEKKEIEEIKEVENSLKSNMSLLDLPSCSYFTVECDNIDAYENNDINKVKRVNNKLNEDIISINDYDVEKDGVDYGINGLNYSIEI